jgi:hypothetical protein
MPNLYYSPTKGMPNTRYVADVPFTKGVNNVVPADYNKLMKDKNFQRMLEQGVFSTKPPESVTEVVSPEPVATTATKKAVSTSTVTPVETK